MAPLKVRQNHSFTPAPPRPPKGPYTAPVSVRSHINSVVFGELFAGTVVIFILAVLFWKVGKYVRSFNKHRVLREGNLTTTRYAKTWYGWVPLEVHQRNKRFFANSFKWILDWLSWESSRMDYNLVWWDPGQEAMEKYQQRRKSPRWMPRFLRKYGHPPADSIWNPGSPTECRGALIETIGTQTDQPTENSLAGESTTDVLQPSQESVTHIWESYESLSEQEYQTPLEQRDGGSEDDHNQGGQDWAMQILAPTTSRQGCPLTMNLHYTTFPSNGFGSRSVPDLNKFLQYSPNSFDKQKVESDRRGIPKYTNSKLRPTAPPRHAQLRKCRMWSAKMQVNVYRKALRQLRDSSGPPGTPFVEILSTFLSEQSALDSGSIQQKPIKDIRHSRSSVDKLPSLLDQYTRQRVGEPHDTMAGKFHTMPARIRRQVSYTGRTGEAATSDSLAFQPTHPRITHGYLSCSDSRSPLNSYQFSLDQAEQQAGDELCDWELRLLDRLNRKLTWIFNETTPGQKPYHFAQLANHWLNRETWLVIDPVSRVPIDSRRKWGDPRFNVPYPEATYDAKSKYPVPIQKRAYTPRIDSWRAAVNKQRRESGVRDAVRTVELYENSIEEPPDGHIDPGSWLFPRPPQGFEVSIKQKNAWYEGGTGWQETLNDWQCIGHGYRLRKLIQEGRVNRNYMKGAASRFRQCCQSTYFKIMLSDMQRDPDHT